MIRLIRLRGYEVKGWDGVGVWSEPLAVRAPRVIPHFHQGCVQDTGTPRLYDPVPTMTTP